MNLNLSQATRVRANVNYCVFCKINKPLRTHHCTTCNACVRVFDHHCYLVNNCIGKRNYKYFILCVFFGFVVNMVFIFAGLAVYEGVVFKGSFATALFVWILLSHSMLIMMYCLFQLSLCLFMGQTTKEFMDEIFVEGPNVEKPDLFSSAETLVKFDDQLTEDRKKQLLRYN